MFRSYLEMSAGPHMILWPQVLVSFHGFVADNLSTEEKTGELDELVRQLLLRHDQSDPRATTTMLNAPCIVMRDAGLI
jgi:hypothetical protein